MSNIESLTIQTRCLPISYLLMFRQIDKSLQPLWYTAAIREAFQRVWWVSSVENWYGRKETGGNKIPPLDIFLGLLYDGDTWLDTVEVNQKSNGGQWNVPGTYAFNGTARRVIISEGNCTTNADAVRFVQ